MTNMEELYGGEPHLLDADTEKEGVQSMMAQLTSEEKSALADLSMPMRHFRQEKVRFEMTVEGSASI